MLWTSETYHREEGGTTTAALECGRSYPWHLRSIYLDLLESPPYARFTATKQGAWRAIAAWHALYAKSKLVPLMPAGDISVGYYLYKSMKLFKGLITHYT